MRVTDNQKGKEIEKQQLNSIKERIRKKHKFTADRRKKQMKEVLPPNTYDIYMANQHSRQKSVWSSTTPNKLSSTNPLRKS